MGQQSRQSGTGQQPQQGIRTQAHLQGVGQFHRHRSPHSGEGTEEGVLKPHRIPKGGEHRALQHQYTAAAQGGAKAQK